MQTWHVVVEPQNLGESLLYSYVADIIVSYLEERTQFSRSPTVLSVRLVCGFDHFFSLSANRRYETQLLTTLPCYSFFMSSSTEDPRICIFNWALLTVPLPRLPKKFWSSITLVWFMTWKKNINFSASSYLSYPLALKGCNRQFELRIVDRGCLQDRFFLDGL